MTNIKWKRIRTRERIATVGRRLVTLICVAALCSCTEQSVAGLEPGNGSEPAPSAGTRLKLSYTIPDSQESAPLTRAGLIPVARVEESKIEDVRLLFFEQDDYGNGLYVGTLSGTVEGSSLEKSGKIDFTMPEGGTLDNSTAYDVLVIANAATYFPGLADTDFDNQCKDRTVNDIRMRFQGEMPREGSSNTYTVTARCLPMTGVTKKEPDKTDMRVSLLRAAVRIDVRVAEESKDKIELMGATLRNIPATIPLFGDPRDDRSRLLAFGNVVESVDNAILGGLYATERYHTASLSNLAGSASCLLVQCKQKGYTGNRCWYAVFLNVGTDGVQYLRRNNAYTVEIRKILSLGTEDPESALQNGDNTLVKTVIIPSEWDVPTNDDGSEVTPPEFEIK